MAKAPKMTLPSVNLDLTLEAGKTKAIIAASSGKSTEYIVKVDQLRTIPGFNVRVTETDDYRGDLEALKQSIREHGFYPNKPLAGYIGKDGDEDVIYVTDGHRRLEAVNEINAEDVDGTHEIEGLPVVLKPAASSVADLTIALVQDNSGRPLTPYEMGVVIQRLQNMKGEGDAPMFTKAEIARKLSITERYVDDLNVLVGAPAKVRTAVLNGEVSSTLAIQELRKNPKKAEERITTAVTKAKASGKAKATKKDIVGAKMQKIAIRVSLATGDTMGAVLQSLAKQLREAVPHTGKADGDALEVDGTISLTVEIPAPAPAPAKEEPAPAKAKRTQSVEKPSKANGGVGGAKKADAKPAAKAKKADATSAAKAKKPAEVEEGEPVRMPPAVPTVESDDPDDI